MHPLIDRMIRAARLDASLYEEVKADAQSMSQAMAVVVLAVVAAGIGSSSSGVIALVAEMMRAFVGWYFWVGFIYLIGMRLLPGAKTEADLGQLLRTTGFSAAPGVLGIVGVIPALQDPVFYVISLWMIGAMTVAVRQALDYENAGRAVAVCVVGFLLSWVVVYLLRVAIFGVVRDY